MIPSPTPSADDLRPRWSGARSLLFVPAHVERFYTSALKSEADVLVLDLEDAVPAPKKDEARHTVVEALRKQRPSKPTLVRVNDHETEFHDRDVAELAAAGVDGFILPKVRSPADVDAFDQRLQALEAEYPPPAGRFVIFPLIETAGAVLSARDIALASPRVVGLVFGHEDYLLDICAEHGETRANLIVPRSQIVLAARAAGCTPVDTPYLDIKNVDGCRAYVKESRALGFSGMLVLHPLQVSEANAGYSPSAEDIANACQVVKIDREAKEGNRSIAFTEGKFVAPPIVKQAKALLHRAEQLDMDIHSNRREQL